MSKQNVTISANYNESGYTTNALRKHDVNLKLEVWVFKIITFLMGVMLLISSKIPNDLM